MLATSKFAEKSTARELKPAPVKSNWASVAAAAMASERLDVPERTSTPDTPLADRPRLVESSLLPLRSTVTDPFAIAVVEELSPRPPPINTLRDFVKSPPEVIPMDCA